MRGLGLEGKEDGFGESVQGETRINLAKKLSKPFHHGGTQNKKSAGGG